MHVLLTNDDGIGAEGLATLRTAFIDQGHRVSIAAPDRERSAASQSLTITRPLRVREMSPAVFAIDGTPADCVHLGVLNLVEPRPEMVVSGINCGLNVGDNIFYSGTVAAAVEGLLLGIPAVAVSREAWESGDHGLMPAAEETVRLAAWWIRQQRWHKGCVLNVNFPGVSPGGTKLTRQGKRSTHQPAVEEIDPMGRTYFWGWAGGDGFLPDNDSDVDAVRSGLISLTPLAVDRTQHDALEDLSRFLPGR